MALTWIQLQWRRNDQTLDRTIRYEVYRADHSVVLDPNRTWSPDEDIFHYSKIMEVQQPLAGVNVLVSDTPDNLRANDDLKTYIGPRPWDGSAPPVPAPVIEAQHAFNRARVWWPAVLNKGATSTPWFYRLRSIDDAANPSDLSHEMSGILQADMHPLPYLLEHSSNGYDWVALPATADLEYFQTGVDINSPYPAFNASALGEKTGPSTGKVTVRWSNPTADTGSPSSFYRMRTRDDAAAQFTGVANNHSAYSPVLQPVNVVGGITDGTGGVEIRYKNTKASTSGVEVVLNGETPSTVGNPLVIAGTFVARNFYTSTPFIIGTDYTIDYANGVITRISTGSIGDGDTVLVEYDYNDQSAPGDTDPILSPYDGTRFTGYGLEDLVEHPGLPEQDAYSYRIRVQDNLGNWSPALYVHATIGDFTPPPPPENFIVEPL